ncbi:MAG: hypothetical protein AAGC46_09425 [Solirubrobacteraceae bacterium]|nr:hypothetical protein [Patulibacter sp.]
MSSFTPGSLPVPPDPLALDKPKELGELLSSAWKLWRSYPAVFVLTAALVVIPIEVILGGVVGHGFYDPEGRPDAPVQLLDTLLLSTVGTALITAIHARAVTALAEKRELTTETAFQLGAEVFWPVLFAALLYFAAIVAGVIAIFVGMIVVAVYGLFATQIAALEGKGPGEALSDSFALVKDNGWWRTLGYQIVLGLFAGIPAGIAGVVIGVASVALGEPSSFGIVAVLLLALVQTAGMSWTALVTTLLYFSWKSHSRLRASGELPARGMVTASGAGATFVKPAGGTPVDAWGAPHEPTGGSGADPSQATPQTQPWTAPPTTADPAPGASLWSGEAAAKRDDGTPDADVTEPSRSSGEATDGGSDEPGSPDQD